MVWLLALSIGWADRNPTCGTVAHLSRETFVPPVYTPRPSADKQLRDIYGMENTMTSVNFAVHYGNDYPHNTEDVEAILLYLEESWDFFVGERDYLPPHSTDTYLLNVYIGNTAVNGPDIPDNVAGYFTNDSQGFPMLVLDTSIAAYHGKLTIAHEFFHALQMSNASLEPTSNLAGRWYLEATAVWAEGEIYPNEIGTIGQIASFALNPHFSINYFTTQAGSFTFGYPYGAGILFRYLTDYWVDHTFVKRSFEQGDLGNIINWWRNALAEEGLEFSAVYSEFAARNAFWDYDVADDLAQIVAMTAVSFPEYDNHLAVSIDGKGTDGWVSPPEETLPQWYGYNHIRINNPSDFSLYFSFEGDAVGSKGSPAKWGAYIVMQQGQGYAYKEIPLVDNKGEAGMEGFSTIGSGTMSIVAWSDEYVEGETFGYQYSIGAPQLRSERECGCTLSRGFLLLFPGLLVYRRVRA